MLATSGCRTTPPCHGHLHGVRARAIVATLAVAVATVVTLTTPLAGRADAAMMATSGVGSGTLLVATDMSLEPTPTVDPKPDRGWMARYKGIEVNRIRTKRRAVALTFDDGPNSGTKPTVDILDKYGAKGTFFATWRLSVRHWMAGANRYVVEHGHELANHTMHHKPLTGSYAFDVGEIRGADKIIKTQTGQKVTWVRAMGGGLNATGLKATKDTGHLYSRWSLDSSDSHQLYLAPERIYHNVVDSIQPGDVVLMHVSHPETVAALPRICKELRRRGYEMVTLSELAASGRP